MLVRHHIRGKNMEITKHKPLSTFNTLLRHNIGPGKDTLLYNPIK